MSRCRLYNSVVFVICISLIDVLLVRGLSCDQGDPSSEGEDGTETIDIDGDKKNKLLGLGIAFGFIFVLFFTGCGTLHRLTRTWILYKSKHTKVYAVDSSLANELRIELKSSKRMGEYSFDAGRSGLFDRPFAY